MSRPHIRKLVRYYCLLDAELNRKGRPFTEEEERYIKRIIAYNLCRRLRSHARQHARLASRRQPRRWHVRPIFQDREIYGAWFSLVPVMRESDPDEFFRFFRMTPDCFDWLLQQVEPFITKKSNRKSISAGERLAITLRYLASGDSQSSLSYLLRLSNQTISKIVTETTAKFPIRGSEFYNYKGTHSIILFAVADAKYRFIVADAGAKGREADSGVFDRSTFGNLFFSHSLRLPPLVYHETIDSLLPFVFVGDDAFPLNEHLMKPYDPDERDELPVERAVFNYRLSRARRVVENTFGILSARFRILRRSAIVSKTLGQNIILSTCALHNLHLMREDSIPPKQRVYLPPGFADTFRANGKLKAGRWRNKVPSLERTIFRRLVRQEIPTAAWGVNLLYPKLVREDFAELFIAHPVPWQWDEPM
ncbi:Protein ALP1-like [Frankliniella fusca]|uniref:Protein ALP1-like n=2 Tax=Frankliniella fusca TaxID=407009 RepID=A0AAE1I087_9NEOP|nr:Protein ALP1-like [Frankliniella fusca]